MPRSLFGQLARRYAPQPDLLSRRRLLKQALAASAGLLLSGAAPGCRTAPPTVAGTQGPRVIVIGAGFAGLACAYELLVAGYQVTVFEARHRIGGRVLSLDNLVPGKTVEGGGEFIGLNHPTWLAYAQHFELQLADVTESERARQPLVLGGRRLREREARRLYEEMEQGAARLARAAEPIDAEEPWKSPEADALDRRSLADALRDLDIGAAGKQGLAAEFTANMGVEPERQSYLGVLTVLKGHGLEKYWTDTETHRCRGGNQLLADRLAERLGSDRLRLGLPVAAVRVRETGVNVRAVDGSWYEADDVVLAVPPSVWSKLTIEPPLPETLRPQMGSNVKYLAAVRGRFWQAAELAPESLSDGVLGMTWEATDGQPGEGAVLASFAGGPAAEACRRRNAEDRRAAFRRDFEGLLPGFGEQFVKDLFLDWPGDPWTLAGYSFPAPGQLTVCGPMLQRGLGRLHFVGEHACFKFMGFMEGGLNSGVVVARRLARRDSLVPS